MLRGVVWLIEYSISLLRVISVLVIALFLPQMFIWHSQHVQQPQMSMTASSFKLGIENVSDSLATSLAVDGAQACRVGLITNQTGTDQAGNRNIEILVNKGFTVNKVFMPANAPEKTAQNARESIINGNKMIPIVPLAMESGHITFLPETLRDIDVLMFDMQDAGMKHYGYVSTLLRSMQAAGTYDKKFIVLDRPNLLGWCMEGTCGVDPQEFLKLTMQDQKMPIPMRHGMTVGELATYFNKHMLDHPVDLQVIPMSHYNRQSEARKPLLCSLSQNIATIDSCYGYSFLGLLGEVHPFEIGIGTDKAFQCILLPDKLKFPKQKWHDLRMVLKEQGIESKLYRCFSQRKEQYCSGLRLYIQDINRFSSFNTLISVLTFFKEAGVSLAFSEQFDKALGSKNIRCLLDGTISHTELALEVNGELQSFFKKAFNCFLYKPFPKMIHV
jgi:uncharacterized protein YbbC (DUF1343 family)